jgi:hypothetical protein
MVREDAAVMERGGQPQGMHQMPDGGMMRDDAMPQGEAQQPGAPAIGGEPQQASPEEQRQYETFVAQGFNLIYDPKLFPQVVEMLRGEGDPQEGLARTAAMVVMRVMTSAQQSGIEFAPDVAMHAGTELFEDLGELSKQAGIHDFSQDPDGLEGSYFKALDMVRAQLQEAGAIDQEAAGRDFSMLQQMDEAGELEGVFRNLAANDPRSGRGGEPEEGRPARRGLMNAAEGRG